MLLDAEALRHFSGYPASDLASPADPGLIGRLAMHWRRNATNLGYMVGVLLMFKSLGVAKNRTLSKKFGDASVNSTAAQMIGAGSFEWFGPKSTQTVMWYYDTT